MGSVLSCGSAEGSVELMYGLGGCGGGCMRACGSAEGSVELMYGLGGCGGGGYACVW